MFDSDDADDDADDGEIDCKVLKNGIFDYKYFFLYYKFNIID
jgi:hypothetical protein